MDGDYMSDGYQHLLNISPPNLLSVCIDHPENGEVSGRIYHCYEVEAIPFSSIVEFIRIAEGLFDEIAYPQSSTEMRNFINKKKEKRTTPCERVREQKELLEMRGEKATFILNVQFRQNSEWQGEITWLEKNAYKRFFNTLGLIKSMDGALKEIFK